MVLISSLVIRNCTREFIVNRINIHILVIINNAKCICLKAQNCQKISDKYCKFRLVNIKKENKKGALAVWNLHIFSLLYRIWNYLQHNAFRQHGRHWIEKHPTSVSLDQIDVQRWFDGTWGNSRNGPWTHYRCSAGLKE